MFGKSVLLGLLVTVVVFTDAIHFFGFPGPRHSFHRSHHLIVGARLPGDRLVCREHVVKNARFMTQLNVERTFNVSKYERITQLRALDQNTDGKGAVVRLMKGGPGQNYATLRFKSQRGHGIKFVVQIYARH